VRKSDNGASVRAELKIVSEGCQQAIGKEANGELQACARCRESRYIYVRPLRDLKKAKKKTIFAEVAV